ncbi:MAG TPA: type II secretion system protein GspM [Rhodocyclaceae bacterium]|nr:type II secretion system protein GspM [Rhodocyclaceae bacterium]
MMASLSLLWQQRQPRERILLAWAALIIAVVLGYTLLVAPALNGRERLQKSLPALRQQNLMLRSLLDQASSLPVPVVQSNPALVPLTKEALELSLKSKNLSAKQIEVNGDMAKLQLSNVAFVSVLDWLNEVQLSAHWQLAEATLNAEANAGIVSASLTLRQQNHE